MKELFKRVVAIITALIVFALISRLLEFIATMMLTMLVVSFDLPSTFFEENTLKTLVSIGLIVNVIFSAYISIKVYKKIA